MSYQKWASLDKFRQITERDGGDKTGERIGKMFRGGEKGNEQFAKFMHMYDLKKGLMGNSFKFFKGNLKDSVKNFKKTFPGKMKKGLKGIFDGWKKVMLVIGKVLLFITLLGIIFWGLKQSGLLDTIKDTAIFLKDYLVNVLLPMLGFAWSGVVDMFNGFVALFTGDSFWVALSEIAWGAGKLVVGLTIAALAVILGLALAAIKLLLGGLWDTIKFVLKGEWGKAGKALGKWFTTIAMLLVVGIGLWAIIASGVSILTAGAAVAGAALLIGGTGAIINSFASGGISPGGMALVGERGPEFVNLPRGARVHSNAESRKMAGNNITINVNGRVGASDTELRDIARKIGKMVNQEINRSTSSSTTYR